MKYNKNGKESKYSKLHTSQSRKIIEVAYKLFISRSFNDVSMKDIARKAHISRQTLYKYYPSLDELIFGIQIRILNDISESLPKGTPDHKTGRELLIEMQYAIFHYGLEHPDDLFFISLFDNYNRNRPSDDPLNQRYQESLRRGYINQDWIKLGQEDGSIRSDINANLLSYFLHNHTAGLALLLANLGENALPADQSVTAEEIEKLFLQVVGRDLQPIESPSH